MAITGSILTGIGAALAKVAGAVAVGAKAAGGAIAAGATKIGTATVAGAKAAGGAIAAGTKTIGGSLLSKSTLIGMGKGAATGFATNAGKTALQGGNAGDILQAGAMGAGTGAVTGTITGAIGNAASGATAANAEAAISKTGTTAASTTVMDTGKPNLLPKITTETGKPNLLPKIATETSASKIGLHPKIPITNNTGTTSVNTNVTPSTASTSASKPSSLLTKIGTGTKNFVKNNAGKIGGQVLLQGGLSLISAGMAAKTASEANRVSQQSLLFQQQTYKEQQAKQDEKEARLKSDAWSAYQSANAFGDKLYNTGTNSLLFTSDYKSNPTGNYSLLSGNSASFADSNISLTKYTDLT